LLAAVSSSVLSLAFRASAAQAKPSKAAPSRYAGYLAAYFSSTDEQHLYYAISKDGFNFVFAVNGGKPIIGATMDDARLRDPMILRDQKGVYHLIATVSWKNLPFTLWDSTDLVHWKNERLVNVAPDGASITWAPELVYDRANDRYVAYWTSSLHNDWSTASVYAATTKDFLHFSKPQLLLHDQRGGILDADIHYANGTYSLFYRHNGVWEVTSKNVLGPYTAPVQVLDEDVEGPFVFDLNGGSGFGMVWDYFGGNQGRWGLGTSSDLIHWTSVTDKKWPYYNPRVAFVQGVRHGCVLPLTQREMDTIIAADGATVMDPRRPQ